MDSSKEVVTLSKSYTGNRTFFVKLKASPEHSDRFLVSLSPRLEVQRPPYLFLLILQLEAKEVDGCFLSLSLSAMSRRLSLEQKQGYEN